MAARMWTLGTMAAALSAVAGVSDAHHSVAGQFDASKRVTITGTVTKIDWINPHTYLYIDVADEQGQVTTWRLESLPTAMLRKAGLTSDLLKGDGGQVTADAILARDGTANLAWVLKLTYEDGHYYQLAGE
jgi:hypothetical protein